jgi:hypothetical protein
MLIQWGFGGPSRKIDRTTGWSVLLDGASIRRGEYDGCSKDFRGLSVRVIDCDENLFALYDITANNLSQLFAGISIEIPEARLENLPRKYHPTLLPKL